MRKLVWRNLLRNKRRTFLTVSSVAMALLILSLLGALLNAMDAAQMSNTASRMVVRSAISLTFSLPEAYEQRLKSLDGVVAVTPQSWFGGKYKDDRPQNFFPRFGINPLTYRDVFPEMIISEEEWAAFESERTAFVAGKTLAEAQGWQLGDRITIQGDIYPMDLELTLRGVWEDPNSGAGERMMLFNRRYVEEATGNQGEVGTFWMLLDNPDSVTRVVSEAEAMFENSQDQVRAETEQAFALSFMEMIGNVRFLFGAIGLAIVVSIFLITANTMAMAARERITEMAVLRTLGFRKPQIVAVVIGEALVVGVLGAALGALLAIGVLKGLGPLMEQMGLVFGDVAVTPRNLVLAVVIGVSIGLLSGFFPAWAAARLKIVDGLRRV